MFKLFYIQYKIVPIYRFFFIVSIPCSYGDEKIPHRIPKVISKVTVDAVLNEEIWGKALMLRPNIEVQPGENIPAPVKTEVLLAYSITHLYIAFRCFDPDPNQIRAHLTDRDKIWDDDRIAVILDTFNDERRTVEFSCNPLGVQADQIHSPQGGGPEWDAIWDSDGRVTSEGYIVEMAIPFGVFPFQDKEGDQIWGIDLIRSYPRSIRHHIGLFPLDRNNNCYMCQADKLIGFAGASHGRDIEIDPTFSAVTTQEREEYTSEPFHQKAKKLDPGVTVRWGFTPNMILSTTANPDFSQVETDSFQMEVNTRFALYYREKRPFFLDDIEIFRSNFNAVHTRTFADPDWGVKLTGKEGKNTMGLIVVRDKQTNLLFPGSEGSQSTSMSLQSTGSIVRYKRDVGESSSLGLILTDREGDIYYNRLAGIDSDLRITQKDRVRLQIIGSLTEYPGWISEEFDQPDEGLGGTGGFLLYNHITRNYAIFGFFRETTPDFRADLGFITKTGVRHYQFGGEYLWQRDPGHWFTRINIGSELYSEEDHRDNILNRNIGIWFNYSGPAQSFVNIGVSDGISSYERKEYDITQSWFGVSLRPLNMLELGFNGNLGDQIDYANNREGTRIQINPWFDFRPGRHLRTNLSHNFEKLKVSGGRLYNANISRISAIYQFSRRTFLRTIVQYAFNDYNTSLYLDDIDPKSKRMQRQVLFSYKVNPQTMLYLGYSDNFTGDHEIKLTQTNRTFFMKIGYAWIL